MVGKGGVTVKWIHWALKWTEEAVPLLMTLGVGSCGEGL